MLEMNRTAIAKGPQLQTNQQITKSFIDQKKANKTKLRKRVKKIDKIAEKEKVNRGMKKKWTRKKKKKHVKRGMTAQFNSQLSLSSWLLSRSLPLSLFYSLKERESEY